MSAPTWPPPLPCEPGFPANRHALLELHALLTQIDALRSEGDAALSVPKTRVTWANPHGRRVVGAENLRDQAIFVNHAPGAIAPLDPELIQIRDAVGQLP